MSIATPPRKITDYNFIQRVLIAVGWMKSDADKALDAKQNAATKRMSSPMQPKTPPIARTG